MARAMPRANARSEIQAALANLADVTTATPLATTRLSGGTMDTTPARPTASHTTHHTAERRRRQERGAARVGLRRLTPHTA